MTNKPKRPRDPNQLAKVITGIATGLVEDRVPTKNEDRASNAGLKGGPARSRALSPQQRIQIAKLAAAARWKKSS